MAPLLLARIFIDTCGYNTLPSPLLNKTAALVTVQ